MHHRQLVRFAAPLAVMAAAAGSPLSAQDALTPRIDRLEREMRAVQRKVFPDGAGTALVEPQIKPPVANSPGSTAPVADLTARVDAVESQLAMLTGQVEQAGFRQKQLEARIQALEARMNAGAAAAAPTATAPAATAPTATAPASSPAVSPRPAPSATAAPAPKPPVVSPARRDAVAAIERPQSGDAGEDAYLYGYRLWEAKFYPEAATQLDSAAKKYPKHRRASYSRNLHGRALLDDGKPASASKIFLANYQADPKGERAPDSLVYLAEALTKQKMTKQACEALAEMAEVYPDVAKGRLATQVAREKKAAGCK